MRIIQVWLDVQYVSRAQIRRNFVSFGFEFVSYLILVRVVFL